MSRPKFQAIRNRNWTLDPATLPHHTALLTTNLTDLPPSYVRDAFNVDPKH